jgi:hypothetical protein
MFLRTGPKQSLPYLPLVTMNKNMFLSLHWQWPQQNRWIRHYSLRWKLLL